jgi:hypothetical protein
MSIVKLNNQAVKNATSFGSISSLGSMVFIKKLTASSSATLSFVDGSDGVTLDNSYKEYLFTFNNIHPANNSIEFRFNGSTDSGSNYNVTKTSSCFESAHYENDSLTNFRYRTDLDLAQSTAFQPLTSDVGNLADECTSGILRLFNPSSNTFVKHYISTFNCYVANDQSQETFVAGYMNTTSDINAVQFKFSSGNIDAGNICLYGIA